MTLISIRERGASHDGPVVSIEGYEYPFTNTDPFSEREEKQLEWYFEEHLRFPFVERVRASEAAGSLVRYGVALFEQIFSDHRAYAAYTTARSRGLENISVEIAGSPAFHRLHWEALRDPELNQPLALQVPFVRRNLQPRAMEAQLRASITINLLVVTARPGGGRDVGYRTISQPMVRILRKTQLPLNIEILRPGTYEALVHHLEEVRDRHGAGYYHIIHFDVHGALLTFNQFEAIEHKLIANPHIFQPRRFGRGKLEAYEGVKAFLFMESNKEGQADPVEATELAQLLRIHQMPIAILNACQSGKQIGDSETSLGSQLMQAGIQVILAMGYSVTVSAAEILMERLYARLFKNQDLTSAIRSARLELHNHKDRRAYYKQTIELEDWLLPVVYQNQPQRICVKRMTSKAQRDFYTRLAASYPEPKVAYEFVGRDLDVLNIERKLLNTGNLLLVRGMGGAGKTTLLHHLGWWWQTTGFVEQVFYFGYDERAWNRQQIMDALARQLMSENEYRNRFQPLGLDAQQAMLTQRLRSTRHLLLLDNLESITGTALAIQNTLLEAEQAALRSFLADLRQGKTLVLLGSRGAETWLAPTTFRDNVYELPGLDPEAASELVDMILARAKATRFRGDSDLERLIKLLDGFPLALQVVLANLARQTPSEVLQALQAGDVKLDTADAQEKTESILECIAYSHSNLSPDAQQLLLCLAPFNEVIYLPGLNTYTEELRKHRVLASLPFERWPEVIQEAMNWGLLTPHEQAKNYLRIQPNLPYFLRTRLNEQPVHREQIDLAYYQLYDQFGRELTDLLLRRSAKEHQTGQEFIALEFDNLSNALSIALHHRRSFFGSYEALFRFLYTQSAHAQAAKLSEEVLSVWMTSNADGTEEDKATELYKVYARVATSYLHLKQYDAARKAYSESLIMIQTLENIDKESQGRYTAMTYHQLGRVAQEQRQWEQAEQYYRQALDLKVVLNDRDSQAATYHELGIVAQEQRQWEQAEQYYRQALDIYIEFNDRYLQASLYHSLGNMAHEQRQWEQAEQYYRQVLDLFIEFNDRYSQAKIYHQLGIVVQEQSQRERAKQYYRQALDLFIEFNDRYLRAKTYHQLGMVAQEQRQWLQALQYLLESLRTFIEFRETYSMGITLRTLKHLWQESGDSTLLPAIAEVLGITPEEIASLFAGSGNAGQA